MKKTLYTLLIATTALSLTGCAQIKSLFNKDEVQVEEPVGVHYVGDQYYTRDESIWKPMHPEDEITYITNYDTRSKYEYFVVNMMEKRYIQVKLPGDYQYTNNGTMIRSTNGAIKINLYDGIVGSDIEVADEVIFNKDIKYTGDGGDYTHSIVKNLPNDYTITAQVGSNSNDWSFIRDMIIEVGEFTLVDNDNVVYKVGLPTYDSSILQSVFPTDEYAQVPTMFNDGYVTVVNSAYEYAGNVDCAVAWLATVADGTQITVHDNKAEETYFAETETGYSIGIFRNNDQYMYLAYGRGEEARTNILRMLYDK